MKISTPNMRLRVSDKTYILNQMQKFADRFDESQVSRVEFGKQDIRGGFSITIFDLRHCVPKQKHFGSKEEMEGYIVGYNSACSLVERVNHEWIGFINFKESL